MRMVANVDLNGLVVRNAPAVLVGKVVEGLSFFTVLLRLSPPGVLFFKTYLKEVKRLYWPLP